MEKSFNELPKNIQDHLISLTKSSILEFNDDSIEVITKNWISKKEMFQDQMKLLEIEEVDTFNIDDNRGAMLLTYSGSLISLEPRIKGTRFIEYSSIKLRTDVPDIIKMDKSDILEDLAIDREVSFKDGPIKKTSSLYKIAVCDASISVEEQIKRIREATIFLTNAFIKLNYTISINDENVSDYFNMKSIVSYISQKNDMTQKQVKQIIDDYLFMVECGAVLGEKVSFGRLGNISVKKRAAQKARIGINPQSGEKITIAAKPAMFVPKINFSKAFKEKCKMIKVELDSDENE